MKLNFFKSNSNSINDGNDFRKPLKELDQWREVIESSKNRNIYIFKHSSRCGVSSMVLKRLEKQLGERGLDYFYLHIQAYRDLSNQIADELRIRHESPQLIVLKSGKVLAHGSHYNLLEIVPGLHK